jgi:tripartite-type tricarboxylate transporter receptor subunit TctC
MRTIGAGGKPITGWHNLPGAGGTVGLAQFINQAKGDPNQVTCTSPDTREAR